MARTTRSPSLQTLRTALTAAGRRIRAEIADGRLHGRILVVARALWLAVAALTAALYVASVWVWIGQVSGPCIPGLCVHGQVPPAVQSAFADLHLSVSFYGWYSIGLNVLFASGFAAVAALLFWRRSYDPLALYISLTLLVFGVLSFNSGPVARLMAADPGWQRPVAVLLFLGAAASGILGFVFPDGRFVPRWTRLASVGVALWFLPAYLWPDSPFSFSTWPGVAFFGGWACVWGAIGAAQVYRYRRVSTPVQRLQTKWVVFAIVAAGMGYLGGNLVVLLAPTLTSPRAILADLAGSTLIEVSFLLVPLCTGVAILRHHLFNIDVIIRRTLIYSILTGTLATIYAIGQLLLQAGFYALTGQGSALAVVGSTLTIAALFQPVRSRVQASVDRRFYRHKYDAARTLEAFSATLRHEVEMAQLSEKLVAVVEETMQPSQVSLWLVRRARQTEPGAWQPVDAAEAAAAHASKPIPLPGLFAVPDDSPTGRV